MYSSDIGKGSGGGALNREKCLPHTMIVGLKKKFKFTSINEKENERSD